LPFTCNSLHFCNSLCGEQEQRAELREVVKPGDMTVAKLLGNCKTFKHTMEYIRATGGMEERET